MTQPRSEGESIQVAPHTKVKRLQVFYCRKPVAFGGTLCDEVASYEVRNDAKIVIHLCEAHVSRYLQGEELASETCAACRNILQPRHVISSYSGRHYCSEDHRVASEPAPLAGYG